MQILKCKNYEELSEKAAELFRAELLWKRTSVLGLATGSSPLGLYRNLIELYKNGSLDFSEVSSVNLDEYRGLSGDNPQSYRYFMEENLFRHINIAKERTFVPDGTLENVEEACLHYDEIIRAVGGIDLQLLGIGRNGHIGFNEPSDHFSTGTHCVKLTEDTISANQRFFQCREEVPTEAYTMGIGSILSTKKILLIASGEDKADAVRAMVAGPVSPALPASILQFHPNVIVIADEAALSKM